MPMIERLRKFLDASGFGYRHTVHPLAYTAREVAFVEHIPPHEMAKTVVVRADGTTCMMVLPANRVLDFQEVRATFGFTHARLATEEEIASIFPDCETGAMPPFGNLYGMPVYVDSALARDEEIAFNAGTHRDVVHMRFADFRRLTEPSVLPLAREMVAHHAW